MNASDRFVVLPGVTLPLAAVQLALDLEDRGLRFQVDGGDLIVSPNGRLTETDREQLRRWKHHICALVSLGRTRCQ